MIGILIKKSSRLFSGAVKITPGHDSKDYDVGKRHSLDIVNILEDDGTMVNVPAPFQVPYGRLSLNDNSNDI